MAERLAFVIAVDSYQDADLPAAAHAEADAAAFARALEALGFARDKQVLLLGGQATKTAVESRLRKLAKAPPAAEALYVYFAGQAFTVDGEPHLACHDTQADDLADTGVPLARLLDALRGSRCGRVGLFLDARAGLPADDLAGALGRGGACFVSCGPGETSHVSGSLKAGIWAHHVVEALAGRAPRALDGTQLTAAGLQVYLEQELPRTLRATFREAPPQTPALFADDPERFVLADLAEVLQADQATADPRLQPLKRGSLRSETTVKVRSLAGYRKFHRLPDRVNAGSRKFVADLAAEDVRGDVDQTYAAIREHLGYKRRDVEGSSDRGSGFVRTPDFEYSVSVDLAEDDPTTVVWRREVAGIRNPEVVLGKAFAHVFGETFDTLVFEFTRPFDLEAWVDRIEEEVPAAVKLRCASDCSSCDVVVTGFAGVIRLYRDRVEITGRKTPGSKGLVEAFLHFQDIFAARRDLQQLPLLESREV